MRSVSQRTGRVVRLMGAAALACGSVPFGIGPAHAETGSLAPTNWGYFYSAGIDKPEQSPAAPPNLTGDHADGVAPGHLGVAAQGGQEEKVSFLFFDLYDLPLDATVTKAVLTLKPLESAPPNDLTYNATPEAVAACKAGPEGFKEDDGVGLAKAPARDCAGFKAVGKGGAGGTYVFDITGLAQKWVSGTNDGVALTRADEVAGSFQVVFDAAPTAKLDLEYSSAQSVIPPVVDPIDLPPVVTPDPAVVVPPPPPVDGGFAPAPEVLTPNPVTNTPPTPVTAQPVGAKAVALSTSMRPTNQFWLAGGLLAAVLVVVGLVLGDPTVPAAQRSRSRLSQALAAQQRQPGGLRVLRARSL